MRLLLYLLKAHWGNFIRECDKATTLVVRLVILLAAGLNTVIISLMLANFNQTKLTWFTLVIFAFAPGYLFFPVYQPKVNLFRPADPVSFTQRACIAAGYHLVSPFYVLITFCLLLIPVINQQFTLLNALNTIGVLAASGVFCLLLQTAFYTRKHIGIAFIIFILAGILIVYTFPLSPLLLPLSLVIWIAWQNKVKEEPADTGSKLYKTSGTASVYSYVIRIYCKTRPIIIPLIAGLVFKTSILVIAMTKQHKHKELRPGNGYIVYMLFSSLMVFTYVHNNVWGHIYRTYQHLLMTRNSRLMFRIYLSLLIIPICIDLIVSVPLFLTLSTSLVQFRDMIIFYFITLGWMTILGFHASNDKPEEVTQAINFKTLRTNTPLGFNLLSMALSVAMAFVTLYGYSLYVFPAAALICAYVYYRLLTAPIAGDLPHSS
ncbi:hypothetical protein [Chitinophaga flava]|uniref:Uncharacterized protein n=1 Tax=Chitinophaga flava TaxID=2259036 RepID=A0A365XTC4_9BACT|nr:hypothetical protein [Chitinophaga flava]RBL88964.1 hypothetical protein DF182_20685 [Chitinophaga flava]